MVKSKLILQLQIRDQMSGSKTTKDSLDQGIFFFKYAFYDTALRTVIHTYPDVLVCIRKYDCPSNPHTSYLLCVFYGLGPGSGTVVEWRDEVAHR